ncbi:MAG TPA: hypothetical protein DCZ10_11555, partial [Pelotomaculum sp.]|nr:hypothetical protein [Pelotomaculum sp.]
VNDVTQKMDKKYDGVWNDLKDDTNSVITMMTSIQEVSKNISNGNLSDLDMLKQIGRRSDNDELTPDFIKMMEAIQSLVNDANDLAQAAVEG